MRNFIQDGDMLDMVAPSGGVVAGLGYLIGGLFVIAATTAAQGVSFAGATEGVFELAAASAGSGQDIAQGGAVYYDLTAHQATKTATGNLLIGAATADKASTDTTIKVNLWEGRTAAPAAAITKPVATASTNSSPYGYATQAQADAVVTAVRALIDAAGLSGIAVPG